MTHPERHASLHAIPLLALVAFGLSSFGGCLRYADLHDQTRPSAPTPPSGERVTAKNCMFTLFYAIPFGPHPLPETKAQADAEGGGHGLVNVDVETDYIWAVIGTVICTKVTGEPAVAGLGPVPAAAAEAVGSRGTPTSSAGPATSSQDRVDVTNGVIGDEDKKRLSAWQWRKVIVVTVSGETHNDTLISVGEDAIVLAVETTNPGLKGRVTFRFSELKSVGRQR